MNEEKLIQMIENDWDEVREKLCNEEVKYNDIEELKKLNFFDRFDDMFQTSGEFAVIKLSEIDLLLRSCNGEVIDKGRFRSLKEGDEIWEEKKDLLGTNRYNEPERGFMYFGISMKKDPKDREYVKKTCAEEIRAFNDDKNKYISTLEFNVIEKCKDKKVLDFSSISNYKSCDDIEKEMNKLFGELLKMYAKIISDKDKKIPKNVFAYPVSINFKKTLEDPLVQILNEMSVTTYLVKIYLKLINDSTFKEVNKSILDKEEIKEKYAPFHAFANYIENMGYSGIIYNSTVHKGGLNLVLFDRDDVEYFGEPIADEKI